MRATFPPSAGALCAESARSLGASRRRYRRAVRLSIALGVLAASAVAHCLWQLIVVLP